MGYLSERLTTLFLAANRIRTFNSLIEPWPGKPFYSEQNFTESKDYLFDYSELIISAHQKIVQVEENLNLIDGAKPVPLIYKNKYMENEETHISYSFAVIEFVVKMLQLISFDSLKTAINTLELKRESQLLYNRTRDFLIYNSNSSLRINSEEIVDKYLGILKSQADAGKTVFLKMLNIFKK